MTPSAAFLVALVLLFGEASIGCGGGTDTGALPPQDSDVDTASLDSGDTARPSGCEFQEGDTFYTWPLEGAWSRGSHDLVTVSYGGRVLVHEDGVWSDRDGGPSRPTRVAGDASGAVWVMGEDTVSRWDGAWTPFTPDVPDDYAVRLSALSVGPEGEVLLLGQSWEDVDCDDCSTEKSWFLQELGGTSFTALDFDFEEWVPKALWTDPEGTLYQDVSVGPDCAAVAVGYRRDEDEIYHPVAVQRDGVSWFDEVASIVVGDDAEGTRMVQAWTDSGWQTLLSGLGANVVAVSRDGAIMVAGSNRSWHAESCEVWRR